MLIKGASQVMEREGEWDIMEVCLINVDEEMFRSFFYTWGISIKENIYINNFITGSVPGKKSYT